MDRVSQIIALQHRVFFETLNKQFRRDRHFYITATLIVSFGIVYFAIVEEIERLNLSMYALLLSGRFKSALLIVVLGALLWESHRKNLSLFATLLNHIKHFGHTLAKLSGLVLFCLTSSVVFSVYTSIKATLGPSVTFRYDQLFHSLDQIIHFGYLPWEFTHALFSHPYATLLINLIYKAWFIVVFLGYLWLYLRADTFRSQFLVTYLLTWVIGGGVYAVLFASAGPCFIEPMFGLEWYQALFNTLNQQSAWLNEHTQLSVWALNTQQLLWQWHSSGDLAYGAGISAMPSMHVATTTVLTIAAWKINRTVGIMSSLFLLFIVIGSVHLGWHYAVDGYASLLMTCVHWKLVGLLFKNRTQHINAPLTTPGTINQTN